MTYAWSQRPSRMRGRVISPIESRRPGGWLGGLVRAPLAHQQVGDWSGEWYEPAEIARLPARIDLLIVDGPANGTQRDARYPAHPMLRSRLCPGGGIFVHDTDRDDEARMVERWMSDGSLETEQAGTTFAVLRCPPSAG